MPSEARAETSASSRLALSVDGRVDVQAPVTEISSRAVPLPHSVAAVPELLASRCAERPDRGDTRASTLVMAGRDGLPPAPGSAMSSPGLSLWRLGRSVPRRSLARHARHLPAARASSPGSSGRPTRTVRNGRRGTGYRASDDRNHRSGTSSALLLAFRRVDPASWDPSRSVPDHSAAGAAGNDVDVGMFSRRSSHALPRTPPPVRGDDGTFSRRRPGSLPIWRAVRHWGTHGADERRRRARCQHRPSRIPALAHHCRALW